MKPFGVSPWQFSGLILDAQYDVELGSCVTYVIRGCYSLLGRYSRDAGRDEDVGRYENVNHMLTAQGLDIYFNPTYWKYGYKFSLLRRLRGLQCDLIIRQISACINLESTMRGVTWTYMYKGEPGW